MDRASFAGGMALAVLALSGCSCSSTSCRAVCGACPEPISFTVSLTVGTGPVTVTGAELDCELLSTGETRCTSATAAPGAYRLEVSAPGHDTQVLSFVLAAAPAGVCCACPSSFRRDVTLVPPGFGDAGPRDAGMRDAPGDAAADDAAAEDDASGDDADLDAPGGDAGACDPDAIRYEPLGGGTLEPGQLCDDVFVCLDTEADGAAVLAASSRFVCSSVPEGPCPGSTCRYADPGGPSTLDENEIGEICAVTVALPSPDVVCMIYL